MTGKRVRRDLPKSSERTGCHNSETLPLKRMGAKPKGGRPNTFIPERTQRALEAIRAGATYIRAAEAAGVDYRTFRRWMERGQEVKKGPYWQFCQAVKKAEEDREETLLQNIIDAGRDPAHWQANAWILERTNPEKYGRKERHEVSGPEGGPLQVRMMTDEELVAAAKKALGKVKE